VIAVFIFTLEDGKELAAFNSEISLETLVKVIIGTLSSILFFTSLLTFSFT